MRLLRVGGAVNVTLETERDRMLEQAFMNRFMARLPEDTANHRMPQYSIVDYVITRAGEVRYFLELKIRKETVEQVKTYGGLMLKQRKVLELHQFSEAVKADVWVVFAFANGSGDVLVAQPRHLLNLPPEDPPRRRNYRGLATDEEPVVYLDWSQHLTQWRM